MPEPEPATLAATTDGVRLLAAAVPGEEV